MTYMDSPGLSRRHRTDLQRRPLDNPPQVDDAVRDRILDAADELPNFTAAELSAWLTHHGELVDTLTVRAVLEA